MKNKRDALFWYAFILITLGCVIFAFAQQTSTQFIRWIGSATAPSAPSENIEYFNTTDNTTHQKTAAGVDKTLVDSLQTAYQNGPGVDMAPSIGSITLNAPPDMAVERIVQNGGVMVYNDVDLGTTTPRTGNGIELINDSPPTNVAGTGQRPSPGIMFHGTVWDATLNAPRTDEWLLYDYPLDNGSDTGRFTMGHRRPGFPSNIASNTYSNAVNFITQENVGGGELIINSDYPNICAYLGATDTPWARANLAFWCLNGNVFKFGSSLGSPGRISVGVLGMSPDNNGTALNGSVFTQWIDTWSFQHSTNRDNTGPMTDPTSQPFVRGLNSQPAVDGTVQDAKALAMFGYAYSPSSSPHYQLTAAYFTLQAQQVAGQEPTVDTGLWQTTPPLGTFQRAALHSTKYAGVGGDFGAAILSNYGPTPTVVSGPAADCASTSTPVLLGKHVGGTITLTTGAAACAIGTVFTVNFTTNLFASAPVVVLTPGNDNAAQEGEDAYVDVASTTTSAFVVKARTALTAATQYVWSYHIIGQDR